MRQLDLCLPPQWLAISAFRPPRLQIRAPFWTCFWTSAGLILGAVLFVSGKCSTTWDGLRNGSNNTSRIRARLQNKEGGQRDKLLNANEQVSSPVSVLSHQPTTQSRQPPGLRASEPTGQLSSNAAHPRAREPAHWPASQPASIHAGSGQQLKMQHTSESWAFLQSV